jgi:hypothetical protein
LEVEKTVLTLDELEGVDFLALLDVEKPVLTP